MAATEDAARRSEFFLWGGLNVVYRVYNALLEGQFRDSEVTYTRSELNNLLGELSVGVTRELDSGLRISFTMRARTPELDDAEGEAPLWGGLIVSRSY